MIAELQRGLLDNLEALFEPRGYRRRDQSFECDQAFVRYAFHVAFIPHRAQHDVDVTADVAVRHSAIEEKLGADDDANRYTVGVELGNLADGRQKRWTLAGPGDLEPVANDLVRWFEEFGEPFLLRYSDLHELIAVLEEGGREAGLICPISARRDDVLNAAREVLNNQ